MTTSLYTLTGSDFPSPSGTPPDIRCCQMTKRKINGRTRSDDGRACHNAFLGIAKTCRKLGVSF